MSRTDLEPWQQLWGDLGASGKPAGWHERLLAAYSEKHRHYHNLQHLDECLREFDVARSIAVQPAWVEAALWFHDAVYNPRSSINEEDSAALASSCFSAASLPSAGIQAIQQLILCTKTHQHGANPDAALLIDIDLAIFGQPPSRFSEYERGIRAEYNWVPGATYAEKRGEILTRFLRRPVIYNKAYFRDRYETIARTNIRRAIEALREGAP